MLIACPACGKRISDRAPACPFCKAVVRAPPVSEVQPAAVSQAAPAPPPPPPPSAVAPAGVHTGADAPPHPAPPPRATPAPPGGRAATAVAAAPRFQPGDFITDQLQVLEVLGEGGFGVVYLAASHSTGMLLALKALRSELLRDARVVEMFRKEARIWIDLGRHPHLVKAHWVDEHGGRLYLAMEYVRGQPGRPNSVEGYLEEGPLPLETALRWAIEFCRGMEHALSRGIRCHRDIKPANILIGEDASVRISDFGIAGLAQHPEAGGATGSLAASGDPGRTAVGTVFGTPTHMAPEQFEDAASCDERSDVYSFGVVLHQMATGRLPFVAPPPPPGAPAGPHDWLSFQRQHREAPPPALEGPLAPLVARCLRKPRGERFPSFRVLRGELEALFEATTGRPAPGLREEEESVADLVNRGLSLSSLGRLQEALDCYERALARAPDEKAIHNNRGNVLRKMGRTGEALVAFDRALALDPRHDDAWYNKGLLLTQAGRLAEGLHCFEQAIAANVRSVPAWIGKAHVLGRLGRTAEELACLDRAIEANPRDPIAWFNKGNVLAASDPPGALACYERALEADPRNAEYWGARAVVLGECGRPEEALACFDEALRIAPGGAQLHYNKGNVYAALGRFADAYACFDAATGRPGCLPIAWYNRALAAHHLGRFDDALGSLRAFVQRTHRGDPFLEGAQALIRTLEAGDHAPLRTTVSEERIESAPETIAIPETPGATAAPPARVRPEPVPAGPAAPVAAPGPAPPAPPRRAAAAPTAPATSTPKPAPAAPAPRGPRPPGTAESWNAKGAELYRARRHAEALRASENALRLDPRNVTALNNQATLFFAEGQREEAVSRLHRVLLLSPTYAGAWFNKGVMESELGRKAEALRSMLEALEAARDGSADAIAAQAREARADLEAQGVRPAPRTHLGWLAAGFQAMVAGQPEKALARFDQALSLRPDVPELWDWKGTALREVKRLDDALACFDAGLARARPSPELHHGRAMTLVRLRRFEEAVAAFDAALALDAEHAASWSDRGKTLGVLNRHEEALASFAHAAELSPENPAPWQNMALLAEQLGRPEEALSHYLEFLRWAKPDMRPQVEHAKARVQVLQGRLAAPEVAAPSRVVMTAGHLDAVLATLVPLAGLDEGEKATLEAQRGAGRREEALVRLAGAEAAGRYLASGGDPADLDALTQAMVSHRAAARPQPAPTAVDAMRADPALRGLIPFADVSSADMAKVAELMKAGRDDEAFALLAEAEARAEGERGGPTPEEAAVGEAALDALMAMVDRRVAEQMAREAAPKPAVPGKAPRPGNPVARKYAERAAAEMAAGELARALESLDQAIARDPSVAAFFAQRGQVLLRLRRRAEALAAFEQALAVDADCLPALVELAGLANEARRYAEAVAFAGRAAGLPGAGAAAWCALGASLAGLERWKPAGEAYIIGLRHDPNQAAAWVGAGQALQRQGNPQGALEALTKGLELDPGSAEGWYQKGNALVDLQKMEDAVDAYSRCVAKDANRAAAWYNLGFALNEVGRHADAIAACDRAIALFPTFERAWVSRGVALFALGRAEEALAAYDQALQSEPDYAVALVNKAEVLRRLGRAEEALAGYDRLVALQRAGPRALRGRAETLDALGRGEDAIAAYEAYLAVARIAPAESRKLRDRIEQLKPKPPAPPEGAHEAIPEAVVPQVRPTQPPPDCQKRGEMALNQGQAQRALEWFDQSIAGDPRNYNAWAGKADALFALGRHLESVAYVSKALEINPRFAPGWQRKALALAAAGRREEGLLAWAKGLEGAPRNIQLWHGHGLALVALGRDAEAVASLDQALAIDSRFSLARYNKALAEERLGRHADAVRSYQMFLSVAPPHLRVEIEEARRKIAELKHA